MSAPTVAGPSPSGGGLGPSPEWEDVLADIGDRIRAERQAQRWSQTELGRRAGLARNTVRRLEDGESTLRCFALVCNALGVDMGFLLSREWRIPKPVPRLAPGQARVLRAVSTGLPLTAAAAELGMRRTALAARMSEIYRRLGVADLPFGERRSAAVRVAVEHGLIDAA
ncbi:helix-turn-helix domain-containing protein [Streptomyces sp. NPDC002623]